MLFKILGLIYLGWATAILAINGQYLALIYLIPFIYLLKITLKPKHHGNSM